MGLLLPDKQVGSTYNLINVTLGGVDPRLDKPYVMYMWNEGGFGGGPWMVVTRPQWRYLLPDLETSRWKSTSGSSRHLHRADLESG